MSQSARAHRVSSDVSNNAMSLVPGGTFVMGSDAFYPEERPARAVTVASFWIDKWLVTNAELRRFVETTEYVTIAERPLDPRAYPGAPLDRLVPGGLVFFPPTRRVDLRDWTQWWDYVPGACWTHPRGPGSSIEGRDDHPVVQIAYDDAEAYAAWKGKALPTEAEWEIAARGNLEGAPFTWGHDPMPNGIAMANAWQGEFPWQDSKREADRGTSKVGAYPANGFGLYDMAGNVWEWTADWYGVAHPASVDACCARHPATLEESLDPCLPEVRIGRKVLKGGSHLCAQNYCFRYRPAARIPQMVDTASCHIGFRCVTRG